MREKDRGNRDQRDESKENVKISPDAAPRKPVRQALKQKCETSEYQNLQEQTARMLQKQDQANQIGSKKEKKNQFAFVFVHA